MSSGSGGTARMVFLGLSGGAALTATAVQEDPTRVIIMYVCAHDGVPNTIYSPVIAGLAPTYGLNTGAGFRGFTAVYSLASPTGTTVSVHFAPGGGTDYTTCAAWALYGATSATPDLVLKTGGYTTHSIPGEYSAAATLSFTERWQGGSVTWQPPMVADFHHNPQGYLSAARPAPGTTAPFVSNPALIPDPYGETSFTTIAWK